MVVFHTYNELYGTVYVHHLTTATAEDGPPARSVREAWYRELMQQRRNQQRMRAGMPFVEEMTDLTVWPGRLGSRLYIEDAKSLYVRADPNYPSPIDVFWPRLPDEQWLQLAATARPHAHQLATESSHDAMLRILGLAHSIDVCLLPTLNEISNSHCPCRSRKSVCDHIAALIECYARTLEHEPLTLLLLGGCAPTDFFALVDNPDHPCAQRHYRPERFSVPTIDARNLYYQRQWHTAPPLPPLPTPPTEPTAAGLRSDLADPAHQLLARAAAGRAANLLSQALRQRRNPLVDPVGRLAPEQDAARLAAYQNPGSSQPSGVRVGVHHGACGGG
ncbi:hypothetical protein [Streptomyces goshikiensis]|uniref:hypothetical protein n=1 Tax=Streptomyces goshikiensis TaxID=1942 RepID=UPI0036566370